MMQYPSGTRSSGISPLQENYYVTDERKEFVEPDRGPFAWNTDTPEAISNDRRKEAEGKIEAEVKRQLEMAVQQKKVDVENVRLQTKKEVERIERVMNAVVIATGLLITSVFPAMFSSFLSPDDTVDNGSGAAVSQTGRTVIVSPAVAYNTFRMLCVICFSFSGVSIVTATTALTQVAISDYACVHALYVHALLFFALAFLTGGALAWIAALTFLDYGYAIAALVVVSICTLKIMYSVVLSLLPASPHKLKAAEAEEKMALAELQSFKV